MQEQPSRAHRASRRQLRQDSERLFAAGELEYIDVLLARRDEVAARIAELDAGLELSLAEIDLRASLGEFGRAP